MTIQTIRQEIQSVRHVQQVNNKEVYNNRTKESFPPKVQLTKLTNKKGKGQNNMEYSFNIITK
jgi:DNA primase